jgi:hypothetical protein
MMATSRAAVDITEAAALINRTCMPSAQKEVDSVRSLKNNAFRLGEPSALG